MTIEADSTSIPSTSIETLETCGDGDCFIHAVFGSEKDGVVRLKNIKIEGVERELTTEMRKLLLDKYIENGGKDPGIIEILKKPRAWIEHNPIIVQFLANHLKRPLYVLRTTNVGNIKVLDMFARPDTKEPHGEPLIISHNINHWERVKPTEELTNLLRKEIDRMPQLNASVQIRNLKKIEEEMAEAEAKERESTTPQPKTTSSKRNANRLRKLPITIGFVILVILLVVVISSFTSNKSSAPPSQDTPPTPSLPNIPSIPIPELPEDKQGSKNIRFYLTIVLAVLVAVEILFIILFLARSIQHR
jgi:hypothetical protein